MGRIIKIFIAMLGFIGIGFLTEASEPKKFQYNFTPASDYQFIADITTTFEPQGGSAEGGIGSGALLQQFLGKQAQGNDKQPDADANMIQQLIKTAAKSNIHIVSVMTTGQSDPSGMLPFTIKVEDIENEAGMMQQIAMPVDPKEAIKNAVILGQIHPTSGKVQILSVEGLNHPMLQQSGVGQIEEFIPVFPDKPISVGESFETTHTRKVPLPQMAASVSGLPAGTEANVTRKTVYTLQSISGNQAIFDVSNKITVSGGKASAKLSGQGQGKGTATFDMAQGFFTHLSLDNQMEMKSSNPDAGEHAIKIRTTVASKVEKK